MSDYNEEIHTSPIEAIETPADIADTASEADAVPVVSTPEPEAAPEVAVVAEVTEAPAPAALAPPANDTVLASSLDFYRNLLQQLDANKQLIHTTRHDLAQIRQEIRELSAVSKREARLEDETDSHGLHTSKVAAQYDDCGSIIAIAEQVRRHVYDNIHEAEELLSPMMQSVDLLKLRVRYIRLLETLLTAQEAGLRLDIQQRNADACIWQLADILKV